MSIYLGLFEFEGPFVESDDMKDESGVYAILHFVDNEYKLLRCGERDSLRKWASRVKFDEIKHRLPGKMLLTVYYTNFPKEARKSIAKAITEEFRHEARVSYLIKPILQAVS
jgi:hypothetical protein